MRERGRRRGKRVCLGARRNELLVCDIHSTLHPFLINMLADAALHAPPSCSHIKDTVLNAVRCFYQGACTVFRKNVVVPSTQYQIDTSMSIDASLLRTVLRLSSVHVNIVQENVVL